MVLQFRCVLPARWNLFVCFYNTSENVVHLSNFHRENILANRDSGERNNGDIESSF